jgi:heme/copper-type cytochrome/quinol oxidase subunit 3
MARQPTQVRPFWKVLGMQPRTVGMIPAKADADFRQGPRLVVQSNGIYWHFVVAIWIPLYVVLYWSPRLI